MEVLKAEDWIKDKAQFKFFKGGVIRLKDNKFYEHGQVVMLQSDQLTGYYINRFFIGDSIHLTLTLLGGAWQSISVEINELV